MIAVETIRPFASVTGETVSDTAITLPSLRTPSVSKLSIDSPDEQRLEDLLLLAGAVGGLDQRDRLPDGLRRRE